MVRVTQPVLEAPTVFETSFQPYLQDLTISLPLGGCVFTRRSLMLGISDGEERKHKANACG